MTRLEIKAGGFRMAGVLLEDKAPKTCAVFKKMLPLKNKLIHVRWSGEGVWIPYGDERPDLGYENNTSHPAPGRPVWAQPGALCYKEESSMQTMTPEAARAALDAACGILRGNLPQFTHSFQSSNSEHNFYLPSENVEWTCLLYTSWQAEVPGLGHFSALLPGTLDENHIGADEIGRAHV